jgi:hypothetical protein
MQKRELSLCASEILKWSKNQPRTQSINVIEINCNINNVVHLLTLEL